MSYYFYQKDERRRYMTINDLSKMIISDFTDPKNERKFTFEYKCFDYKDCTVILYVSRMYVSGHVDFFIHAVNNKLELRKYSHKLLVRKHEIPLDNKHITGTLLHLFEDYCTHEKIDALEFIAPEVEAAYIKRNKIRQVKINISKAKRKQTETVAKIEESLLLISAYQESENMYKELAENILSYDILSISTSAAYPKFDYVVELARTEFSKSKFYIICEDQIDLSSCNTFKEAKILYDLEPARSISPQEIREMVKEICIQELIEIPNAIKDKEIYLKELDYDLKKYQEQINYHQEKLKKLKESS